MIDRRLLDLVEESRFYTFCILLLKTSSLLLNILLIQALLDILFSRTSFDRFVLFLILKALSLYMEQRLASHYSTVVKKSLRQNIFTHLFQIETDYQKELTTSELVQVSLDGVTQLDAYYHLYIPQFFYSLLAPIILFLVLSRYHFKIALMLLLAVPLIPLSIVFVQKIAKNLLDKYWGQYTQLGDTFLDRLQGLLAIKIYEADQRALKDLDREAEDFRLVTMRVLMMQLNSISVMDLIAYGGSALAMIASVKAYRAGGIDLRAFVFIVLLSADYFIPMRQLGSYFHLSMNGVAASERIHRFLAIPVKEKKIIKDCETETLHFENVSVYYEGFQATESMNLQVKRGEYHVIVGESGSGKSSLMKACLDLVEYDGKISLDQYDLKDYHFRRQMMAVLNRPDLFNMNLYENICLAVPHSKDLCQAILERLHLDHLSLDQDIYEDGRNLSGGEKQRIAFSRLLLNQRDFYLLDEITSNVDVESETIILEEIEKLVERGSGVLFITHRLKNAEKADQIHVFKEGRIVERGNHEDLMLAKGEYYRLYKQQEEVENLAH